MFKVGSMPYNGPQGDRYGRNHGTGERGKTGTKQGEYANDKQSPAPDSKNKPPRKF